MAVSTACITGSEVHRQWQAGSIRGESLGPRQTPFGPSGELFLAESEDRKYYLLARYGAGMGKTAPAAVNCRANIYALKDLGVQNILAWGSGAAITHSMAVGDVVILNDVIDRTTMRANTFFEGSPLGFLRQFPVFCTAMRDVIGEVLHGMKLIYHGAGTAAVTEGPRLETPAEVRALASLGVEIVTHAFVPELFLAKELQMCYAALCYVVRYAEAGLSQTPFTGGRLFEAMEPQAGNDRLAGVVGSLGQIVANVASAVEDSTVTCRCSQLQSQHIEQYSLSDDWREWFDND